MNVTAVYPGTFDPFTNGHCDLVRRALRLFPRLVPGGGRQPAEEPAVHAGRAARWGRPATADLDRLEIDTFDMLTVEYVRNKGAQVIVRGVRAVSDFLVRARHGPHKPPRSTTRLKPSS